MFTIGNHKNIQTRDCYSELFFDWHTASISQYSVVADSLKECYYCKKSTNSRDDLVEWITTSGTTHIHSSSIVRRHEFDDQWGLFYKRSVQGWIHIAGNSRQKGSVDLKATMWIRNSIVLVVPGPYHGSIQLTLCATMLLPRRLHNASTTFSSAGAILYLQEPSP